MIVTANIKPILFSLNNSDNTKKFSIHKILNKNQLITKKIIDNKNQLITKKNFDNKNNITNILSKIDIISKNEFNRLNDIYDIFDSFYDDDNAIIETTTLLFANELYNILYIYNDLNLNDDIDYNSLDSVDDDIDYNSLDSVDDDIEFYNLNPYDDYL